MLREHAELAGKALPPSALPPIRAASRHPVVEVEGRSQGHSVVAIIFKGLPPHELGPAESASARSTAGDVEMTLHVLDDWHSPTLVAIRIKMPPGVARSLADQLASAAAEGDKAAG
jgi:hypothetical protein